MLYNSDSPLIHELYKDYQSTTHIVPANRMINSKGTGRGKINELIIKNYKERV